MVSYVEHDVSVPRGPVTRLLWFRGNTEYSYMSRARSTTASSIKRNRANYVATRLTFALLRNLVHPLSSSSTPVLLDVSRLPDLSVSLVASVAVLVVAESLWADKVNNLT